MSSLSPEGVMSAISEMLARSASATIADVALSVRPGAHERGPLADAARIRLNGGEAFEEPDKARRQTGCAKHDISRAEIIAQRPRTGRKVSLERRSDRSPLVPSSLDKRREPLRLREALGVLENVPVDRLQIAERVGDPLIVVPALRSPRLGRESLLGELVSEVENDRRGLEDHRAVVIQRGYGAVRMNAQVLGRPIIFAQLDPLQLVGNAQFFEQPTRPGGAGSFCVVELECHRCLRNPRFQQRSIRWEESRMTSQAIRDPVKDNLLTPQNSALIIIDSSPPLATTASELVG